MARTSPGTQYNVSNLLRGLDVLELLMQHSQGLGVSEISRHLGIPKNAAFRITSALHERGYLLRNEDAKTLRLSARLMTMGYRAGNRLGLVEAAMPQMRQLRDAVGETVVLCTVSAGRCMAIDGVPGIHPFRLSVDPGLTVALHASAPGKAILAMLPEPQRQMVLASLTLTRFNERTITSHERLLDELAEVRRQGYALDRGEEFDGVHCAAAPILDPRGYPVAALTVTGPAHRLTDEMLSPCGRQTHEHTEAIAAQLSFASDNDLLTGL
jgi:DNA-binding IclR family transcriptional regulator